MSSLASPAYTDGLSLDTRGCRSSLKSPVTRVSKTLSEALLCDSPLDDRSLTPPARQGTKEGPTPSPSEMTAPHQCLCGLPGRDGRRGTSARGDASSPYPRGSPPPRPGRPRAGRHGLRRRERPSRRPRRRRPPPPPRAAAAPCGRSWQTLALLLPNCRECAPDPVVGFAPSHEATCSRSALPVLGGGSRASAAYRPDQAWRSSRPLENLSTSRQLTSSDDPWETLAGGHFDAPSRTRRDEAGATRTAIRAA